MSEFNLTRGEAEARRDTITTHAYRVALDFMGDDNTFTAITEIDFSAQAGSSTFIDLCAQSLDEAELNGTPLDTSRYSNSRFPLDNLSEINTVRLTSTMLYSHTGEGLHRYTDPADGETYLYSQFEVADACRTFATFEQPDLKACFTFIVDAPEEWTVFSNAPVRETQAIGNGARRWFFEETAPMSTYITAIVAGPYQGTNENTYTSSDGRVIPLGVYARKSLAQYVDTDEIITITRQGFEFYEKNYGHPYPFRKYDQVFCPEFNAGAMENAGLVTIVENYIFKNRPDGYLIDRRAITILHELAHMWFGNLVTTKWWNDLWLNESFAEYMSYLAASENTRWTNAWTTFFASGKVWAIEADQLPSSHPISANIRDLEDVQVNFDGITYSKGGSVLRQLVAWVGQENFLAGVREYIAKHKWSNATLSDLLAELEISSGRDLSSWTKLWLEEAGINTFTPHVEADTKGTITDLTIYQSCDSRASLRPHRIRVAGYDFNETNTLVPVLSEELDISEEYTPVSTFTGHKRPALILVNDGDYAYAKLRFDDVSLTTALSSLSSITDPLARNQVLFSLWDMCRDGEMSATDFARVATDILRFEENGSILRVLLNKLRIAVKLYSHPATRETLQTSVADTAFELLDSAQPGSERQFQLAGLAMSCAISDAHFDRIEAWLDGRLLPQGYNFDNAQRWLAVTALAAAGRWTLADIRAEYENNDRTSFGQEAAALAEGTLGTPEDRERIWQDISGTDISNARQRALCAGSGKAKPEAVAPYAHKYFEQAITQWNTQSVKIASNFLQSAFPIQLVGREDLGVDIIALGEQWLSKYATDAPPACTRLISEAVNEAVRAKKAQEADVPRG